MKSKVKEEKANSSKEINNNAVSKKKKFHEKHHDCVQCGSRYFESQNSEEACSFHTEGVDENGITRCCGLISSWNGQGFLEQVTPGCQKSKHSSTYHDEYPYRNYFVWAQLILKSDHMRTWFRLERKDYNHQGSGFKKYALVGAYRSNMIFAVGIDDVPKRFKIFQQSKDASSVELSDPKLGWFMRVDPIKGASPNVLGFEISVKSTSDKEPCTIKCNASLNGTSWCQAIAFERKMGNNVDLNTDTRSLYDLPDAKFSGSRIPDSWFQPAPQPRTFQATGDLQLNLFVDEGQTVKASQTNINGRCFGVFEIPVVFEHTASGKSILTDVHGEILQNGQWIPASQTDIGFDPWGKPPTYGGYMPVTFHGKQEGSVAMYWIKLVCELSDGSVMQRGGKNCCHTSLGNPVLMRLTVISSDAKSKTLQVEQVNPPLEKIQSTPNTFYVLEWPDTKSLEIPFVKFSRVSNHGEDWLQYKCPNHVSYHNDDDMMIWAWKAKNSSSQIFRLDDLCKKFASGNSVEVFALVDLSLPLLYGFKVVIKTSTGEAEKAFQIRKNNPQND